VRAYDRALDMEALARPTRVGLSSPVMRRVVQAGLDTPVPTFVRAAALVVLMFVFSCRTSSAIGLRGVDVDTVR
jgi:hypothetical protein